MDIEGSWNQRNKLKCNILIKKVKKSGISERTISVRFRGYLKTDFAKLRWAGYSSLLIN